MSNKKVLVPLIEGFEETEYIAVRDILIRKGIDVDSVSLTDSKMIVANHNTIIGADSIYKNLKGYIDEYDALFIPGGTIGVENLDSNIKFDEILFHFSSENKIIAAICAAPSLLAKRGLLKNKKSVVFPDKKLIEILIKNEADYINDVNYIGDGNIFTGTKMQISIEYAENLAKFIESKN
ncbi:MAG: protease [Candidatus Tyloplasma litorale]|nr:MAG: protease [Mycoplasmatales bacterium]